MHDYIKERTIKIGRCIVETRKTVRTIAKEFGVSKSTVHKDLTERLPGNQSGTGPASKTHFGISQIGSSSPRGRSDENQVQEAEGKQQESAGKQERIRTEEAASGECQRAGLDNNEPVVSS